MKTKLKFRFLSLSLLTPICLVFPLVSCSASYKNNPSLYENDNILNESKYNYISEESKEIQKITLSISFQYKTHPDDINYYSHSGTAWIFKKDNDNYYLATNMHVANILTFENKTFTSLETGKVEQYDKIISSSIRFIPPNTKYKDDSNKDIYINQQLEHIYVEKPEIVYTTVEDEEFNKNFPDKVYGAIYQNTSEMFNNISDIAILKYYLPKNEQYYKNIAYKYSESPNISGISPFIEWLNMYETSKISIFDDNYDTLSEKVKYTSKFYMGGFPTVKFDTSINEEIIWMGFSNFQMNPLITRDFEYSWNVYKTFKNGTNPYPISYFNESSNLDNIETYNYVSASRQAYFYAHSLNGSSGSPIVMKIGDNLKIIGIYWGTVVFNIDGKSVKMGVADIFSTDSKGKKFNLINNINKKIIL